MTQGVEKKADSLGRLKGWFIGVVASFPGNQQGKLESFTSPEFLDLIHFLARLIDLGKKHK